MKNNITYPVHFLSLGPGGAENVTLGNAREIDAADKIFCFGTHGKSHCADTLSELTDLDKVKVIDIPMSKDRTSVLDIYKNLATSVAEGYASGKKIAIATEGDSGLFATTHYVMDMLTEQGIPCIQHAGIPAFIGAGAIAGLHIAKLEERLTIVPGNITAMEIADSISKNNNLVVMKLSMATEAIHECMNLHPEFHYHYFCNIGTDNQEYINDIATLKGMQYPYFSLMIIQK